MVLTNFPIDPRFDLSPWVAQRQATFRFALVDGVTNQPLRDLTPIRDDPPTLSHDTSRTIPRTLTLSLGVRDVAFINTINNRVLPYMVIGGEEFPLGRYMFADNTRQKFSSGDLASLPLVDETFIINQPIETGFSALVTTTSTVTGFGDTTTPLEQVDQTMKRLLAPLSVHHHIDVTPYSSIGSWSAGTTRASILNSLAIDGDYFTPWYNNMGILRIRRSFDPKREIPDFDLDASNKVYAASIVESDNLLDAANRIIIISNGVSSDVNARAPVIGRYDIPASAPHSIFNRGFVIPDVQTRQVESAVQATAIAKNIAIRSTAFEVVELTTPPDPRHDGHNVIRWDDKLWLETSWSMEMIEGGEMRHTLQRVYV